MRRRSVLIRVKVRMTLYLPLLHLPVLLLVSLLGGDVTGRREVARQP